MNQNAALCITLLFCWLLLIPPTTQGSPLSRNIRCRCIKSHGVVPNVKSLQKLEVIPASSSCPHIEIIATMKRTQEQRCLNPDSKKINDLIKLINKKRSKEVSNHK
ncbi:C-X-C motif chemokine 10 [Sarcophilus harrisii]|uniref:C-X-C motif chemokine 10 n=1 Tax=Sarcophilus harrisii TaxID=9305 RepID=A0A7N4P020_SARHA|nr:C-X-C motif chemokine 10 [Sarcophilus harrisii]